MNRLLVTIFLLLLPVTSMVAQEKGERKENETNALIEKRALKKVDRVSELVELSEKQKKDLLELYIDQETQRMRERESAEIEQKKRREERKKGREREKQELERILGEDKYNEYRDKKKKRGLEKKDETLDNFLDFMDDSFELDEKERDNLRRFYLEQEKNLKSILEKLNHDQKDTEKLSL